MKGEISQGAKTRGRKKKEAVTGERVVREMANIAFSSFTDFARVEEVAGDDGTARREVRLVPTGEIPPERRAALAGIKQTSSGIEIKLCDKWKALEALARILGLYGGNDPPQEEGANIIDDI